MILFIEFYKQDIDSAVKQFNSNVKKGLNEQLFIWRDKNMGKNILKVTNTKSIY